MLSGQPIRMGFMLEVKRLCQIYPNLNEMYSCIQLQFEMQHLTRSLHRILKREDWKRTRTLFDSATFFSAKQATLFMACFTKAGDTEGVRAVKKRLDDLGFDMFPTGHGEEYPDDFVGNNYLSA